MLSMPLIHHQSVLQEMLVKARKRSGLKQVEVATRLNKPQSFVSKVETGERQLSIEEFVDLVNAMGCHPVGFFADFVARVADAEKQNGATGGS